MNLRDRSLLGVLVLVTLFHLANVIFGENRVACWLHIYPQDICQEAAQ